MELLIGLRDLGGVEAGRSEVVGSCVKIAVENFTGLFSNGLADVCVDSNTGFITSIARDDG